MSHREYLQALLKYMRRYGGGWLDYTDPQTGSSALSDRDRPSRLNLFKLLMAMEMLLWHDNEKGHHPHHHHRCRNVGGDR